MQQYVRHRTHFTMVVKAMMVGILEFIVLALN